MKASSSREVRSQEEILNLLESGGFRYDSAAERPGCEKSDWFSRSCCGVGDASARGMVEPRS